jgi:predicted transcriptional regulator
LKNVLSVRLDKETIGRLRSLARRQKKEISTVARELMDQGWVFVSLREYRQGKLSLGTMAGRLGLSLAEAIDLLSELGVRSPLEYDDYLQSYAAARRLVGVSR